MLYMVTFTINIPPMLAYIPYMDPMGIGMFDSRRLMRAVSFQGFLQSKLLR